VVLGTTETRMRLGKIAREILVTPSIHLISKDEAEGGLHDSDHLS